MNIYSNSTEGYFIADHPDPEERRIRKRIMDNSLQYAKRHPSDFPIDFKEHYFKLKGIFFTKHGQCVDFKVVTLLTDYDQAGRKAILIRISPDWQSYRFKEWSMNEQPSLSILYFALIPLKKANVGKPKTEEGRPYTVNLFQMKKEKKERFTSILRTQRPTQGKLKLIENEESVWSASS